MQGHDEAPSTTVTFYVSHVQVTIECAVPDVITGLSAVWRSAARPLVPTTRWERFSARGGAQGFSILHGTRQVNACEHACDVLPLLESALYAELRAWHEGHALLHAACVVGPMGPLLLLGDSGAGKSTLARAAVARGYRYATDELTVCNDATVWGVPRAIQFDVVRVGDERPAYLDGADLDSYRMRAFDGAGALPLFAVGPAQVLARPAALAQARLCLIERGAGARVHVVPAFEKLAALHRATMRVADACLEPLLQLPALRLTYADPIAAFGTLEAAVES